MSEVKAGQRWEVDGVVARVVAICKGFILFDDGRCWGLEAFNLCDGKLLPSRENEYVAGESVEIYKPNPSAWIAASYCLQIDSDKHVAQNINGHFIRSTHLIRRPKPETKWVVPTQADLDAANEPIPCLVRDGGKWQNLRLHGVAKFGEYRFSTTAHRWKYCLIQVPVSDPRPAMEVQS